MSSVSSFETDMRKLRNKRKRKRLLKNIMMILLVVAAASAVYLSRGLWLPYLEGILERGISSSVSSDIDEQFPIDISKRSNVDVSAMGNCWTLFSDTTFYTCNSDGSEIFSAYLPYSNPVVETSSRRALIYDMGGYNLTVVSRNSEVYSKKLENQILFAEIGKDGNIAVVTSTDRYTSYLTIYDKNGNEIFHWADGNLITSVCLEDSGSGCIISSVYALGGSFKSVVFVLDFSQTEVAAKTSPVNTLCLGVEYTNNGGFWLVGDQALYRFDSSCMLEYSFSYSYDISKFAADGDVCAIVFSAPGSKETYLTLFESSLDSATEITYNEEILHLDIYDEIVYFNTTGRINAVDYTGILVGTATLDSEYVSFAIYDGDAFLLGYRSINKAELTMHD